MAHLMSLRYPTRVYAISLALLPVILFTSPAFPNTSIQLTWEASPDEDILGYHVYMGTSSGSYPTKKDAGFTQSHLFQNLTDGKSYYFMVTAYDQMRNESGPSEEATVTIPDTTPPSTPGNITLSSSSNAEISIHWTASTDNVGVTAYDVARDGMEMGLSQTTSFIDSTITPGTTYLYTVRALDAVGNTSAWSTPLEVAIALQDTTPPSVPQNLKLNSASDTQVAFSWTASTDNVGVTAYDVARDGMEIGLSQTTSFIDSTITPGTTYLYTVKAMDAQGNTSAWSTPLQVTTPQALAQLTVSANGNGSITSNPNGINCPKQNCTANYPHGTVVTLTATPKNGWSFDGWSGSCIGTDLCTITVTGNMAVNANFSKSSGGGSETGGGKGRNK